MKINWIFVVGCAAAFGAIPACAATATAPEFESFESPAGYFSCDLPKDLPPESSQEQGVLYTRLTPEALTYLDIVVHPLTFRQRLMRTPVAASYAAQLQNEAGVEDFKIVEPLHAGSFQGLPAWTLTREFTVSEEGPEPTRKLRTRDTFLIVQRAASFLVVHYQTRPSFFSDHLPTLQHILDTLRFQSEPFWTTSRGIDWLAAILLALVVLLSILAFNRR